MNNSTLVRYVNIQKQKELGNVTKYPQFFLMRDFFPHFKASNGIHFFCSTPLSFMGSSFFFDIFQKQFF